MNYTNRAFSAYNQFSVVSEGAACTNGLLYLDRMIMLDEPIPQAELEFYTRPWIPRGTMIMVQ